MNYAPLSRVAGILFVRRRVVALSRDSAGRAASRALAYRTQT
jgi:hypothetical protein